MNDHELLARLQEADPFSGVVDDQPASRHSRAVLLNTITRSAAARSDVVIVVPDTGPRASSSGGGLRRKRWTSPVPVAVAASAVGLILGGTALFGPGTEPTASAAVVQVAEAAADVDSGEVTGSISMDGFEGSDGIQDTFEYHYAGDDYYLSYVAGNDSETLIGVDDTVYRKDPADSGEYIPEPRDGENASALDSAFDLSVETAGPGGIVALLEQAKDVTADPADGARTVSRGTLSAKDAASLEQKPLALSLLERHVALMDGAEAGPYEVEAVVVDGLLGSITVSTDIALSKEVEQAVITITFDDLGTRQAISAPQAEEVRDYAAGSASPDLERLLTIVEDFNARYPGDCAGVDLTDEAFSSCMEKAGEGDAADEVRQLQKIIPSEAWGARYSHHTAV